MHSDMKIKLIHTVLFKKKNIKIRFDLLFRFTLIVTVSCYVNQIKEIFLFMLDFEFISSLH